MTPRIVSLLSSATEIVYELGLQEHLVGISHECDFPPEALRLPRLSRSRFDPAGMDSGEIDAAVRRSMEEFGSVYEVDADALAALRPDVVLTQAVCEVCAVPTGSVEQAVAELSDPPDVVSLDAHTLEGILATIRQVADAAGVPERGEEAVARLRDRIDRVLESVEGAPRPRVLALEWLDPPFAPGHWVPEMVEIAGGDNLVGRSGRHSAQISWAELHGQNPDRLLLIPCGYDLDQAQADSDRHRDRLDQVAGQAIADGGAWVGHGAFFSRSGPRVVGGIEALSAVFHPDRVPGAAAWGRVARWL
jgi:iron complex transport system substrate-binding protein